MYASHQNLAPHIVNFVNLDPIEKYMEERLMPIKDLKEIHIWLLNFQTTKLGTSLIVIEDEERELNTLMQTNIDILI